MLTRAWCAGKLSKRTFKHAARRICAPEAYHTHTVRNSYARRAPVGSQCRTRFPRAAQALAGQPACYHSNRCSAKSLSQRHSSD